MSATNSGRGDLERRAWRSVFQDGLWDIALGVVFLGVGLSATFHLPRGWAYAIYAVAVVLNITVLRVGKQRITIPRLGWVRFGPRAERRRLNAFLVLTIGVALTLALVPLTDIMRPSAGWVPLVPALAVGVMVWALLSLAAAFWGFTRLYLHAFIIGASFFGIEFLGRGWPMIAGSAVVLAIGMVCLARFLKLYPKPPPEDASAYAEAENQDLRFAADIDVQRRAYRTLNEDGLVDFSLGLGLSFAALYIGLWRLAGVNMAVWSGLFPIFVMLIARGLRKRFVYPRIGYARVRSASPAILLMATLGLLLVAGLVVMTVYARRGVRPPGTLVPWMLRLFALAGAGTLALMGRRTGLARFYVHAAVILVAALASAAISNTDYGLLLMLGLPGLTLLVTGTVCFFRFLRRHPRPIPEATHANS